ncbi:uncharacterized protein DEA37_0000322 [Paragonimus westermani]|uniref:Uncharacterized protein n=1 Tax=Paragonimus westermani TaxID=34504 RepID=A0A5J4NW49_9TREM|nr:uncharacterized protein DEA37_0000322 [Paragonimus westermani]
MENKVWTFTVPVYPVNFRRTTRTVLKYVNSHVNKFVPDLNAVLIEYQKNTLHIMTCDHETRDSNFVVVPIRPELPTVHVRAQVNVCIFTPRLGLELTVTVCAVQPHLVLCKTNVSNVTVTLPRCPETGTCSMLTGDVKNDPESQVTLYVDDVVVVRLSAVCLHPNLLILRGELVRVVHSVTTQSEALVRRFISSSEDEEEEKQEKRADLGIPKRSLKKNKKTLAISLGNDSKIFTDDSTTACKLESPQPKHRKRLLLDSEPEESVSTFKMEDHGSWKAKKQRSNEMIGPSIMSGLTILALPCSSYETPLVPEDYKVVTTTPQTLLLSQSFLANKLDTP